jgi:fructose-bisphosphate aldolase class II
MGVTVEAEIGRLGGVEEHIEVSEEDAFLTNPEEAQRFVEATGCDYLAIAIGTSHGAFKGKGRPFIDHARIEKVASLLSIPLVAHGSSGVPATIVERLRAAGGEIGDAQGIADEDLQRATQHGIAKVNVDTDLRLAMTWASAKPFRKTPRNSIRARSSVRPATSWPRWWNSRCGCWARSARSERPDLSSTKTRGRFTPFPRSFTSPS